MATEDLLSYAEAKTVVSETGASTTTNGALLVACITAVSQTLAEKCGPIVQETVTDEAHDGGTDHLWVRRWPVTTFTTITEYEAGTGTALTAETAGSLPTYGYYPEPYSQTSAPYSGRVWRRTAGSDTCFPAGRGKVTVTYTAGRYASTGAVSEKFKTAARMTIENWWQQYREGTTQMSEYEVPASSFPRFAVPNAVVQLLGNEMHLHDDASDIQVG